MSTQEQTQENAQADVPSKEKIIEFFTDQIAVKKVQYELQELNTKLAVARAEELKALAFISQMSNPGVGKNENPYEGGQPHTITQEDLDNNPELAENGLKVGDEVLIPIQEEQEPAQEEQSSKKRGLKRVK